MEIEFPNRSRYDLSDDAVVFPVLVDGAERRCKVFRAHLQERYGAAAAMDLVGVLEDNRFYIQGEVIARIKAGVQGTIMLH
ncbi:MAG TPA: DUF1488 family protein [Noviherbaspirillum sp.]|jgi:hypothetical protein|uniref:DUF1488 family protein n=1 Tax=Noviherbaspirillum sp. TaxID=1926288 RepID=UPI002F957D2E